MKSLLDKKNLLVISFLLSLTILLNGLVFLNQLNYGFRDVDWQVLYYFKLFGKLSLNHLLKEIQVLGVYITESYYVGFLEQLIGLDFSRLHLVTQLLKVISAISVYLAVLTIFKKKLLAFITSLIYTISYTHAGVLFQLSSGGYFLATIFMNLFLISYYKSFHYRKINEFLISIILLIVTFILKPERMYPLIILISIIELFVIILGKFKKERLVIFLPLIILYPFYFLLFSKGIPSGFAPGQFLLGATVKIKGILNGNLQLLLEPFASLGSIFLYGEYWKMLGQLNFQDFPQFISSLIFGPILRLGFISLVPFFVIGKKSLKLIFNILVSVLLFGIIVYLFNFNWQHLVTPTRIHFDPNLIAIPSILGFYVLVLNCMLLIDWLKNKDRILIPPILGIAFSFLFILLTWISSDILLIFMGPQRYLSIPSIGTSIFISGFLVIAFDRLKKIKFTKQFSWIIFLFLVPLFIINYQVANKFFEDELNFAGAKGIDQTRMKNKLRLLMRGIDTQDKSLFYFDETQDRNNAYFNEGTVLAGFEYWTKLNEDGTLNDLPTPGMIRSTRQCPEHTHLSCIKVLKDGLRIENGDKGVWYADSIRGNIPNFYKLNNFHAYRFINKDIIDIRDEVLREVGL
ncbi:hypothetical protein HYW41_02150 [Candidatus Daviesbacteria bacterium]|nr:hypothetical protein [Candidatus Daviesbacteria bacterium]